MLVVALPLIAAGAATVWWLGRSLTQTSRGPPLVFRRTRRRPPVSQDGPMRIVALRLEREDEFVQVIDAEGRSSRRAPTLPAAPPSPCSARGRRSGSKPG